MLEEKLMVSGGWALRTEVAMVLPPALGSVYGHRKLAVDKVVHLEGQ